MAIRLTSCVFCVYRSSRVRFESPSLTSARAASPTLVESASTGSATRLTGRSRTRATSPLTPPCTSPTTTWTPLGTPTGESTRLPPVFPFLPTSAHTPSQRPGPRASSATTRWPPHRCPSDASSSRARASRMSTNRSRCRREPAGSPRMSGAIRCGEGRCGSGRDRADAAGCPRVCRSGRSSGVSRRNAAGAARMSWPGRGCERRGGHERRRCGRLTTTIDDVFTFFTHGARSSRR